MKKKDVDREYRKFVEAWLPKYAERLTLILLSLKDKRDIREPDWDVVNIAFRNYYMGYLPDFIPPWQPWQPYDKNAEKQTTIFDIAEKSVAEEESVDTDKITDNNLGTDFAIELPQPTIIIEDDTKKE